MRLTMELDLWSQPIAGWLQAKGGPRQDFVGMLELISLLEALRQGSGSEAASDPTPEQPGNG
jgi:hypothetical protein